MAAKHPRINVTVTPDQHRLLLALGELEGRSASSYLRQLLDQAQPVFEALLPVYLQAAQQAAETPEKLRQAIAAALAEIEHGKSQLSLLDHLAGIQGTVANDRPGASPPAPSGAREEAVAPRRASRKRP